MARRIAEAIDLVHTAADSANAAGDMECKAAAGGGIVLAVVVAARSAGHIVGMCGW